MICPKCGGAMKVIALCFRLARENFPSKYAFRASIFAIFIVIDITERPEVHYQRGQTGRFIGRSGYCGAAEKGISYKFALPEIDFAEGIGFPELS